MQRKKTSKGWAWVWGRDRGGEEKLLNCWRKWAVTLRSWMSRDPGTQPLPALSVRRFSTSAWRTMGSGLRGDREMCSFRKTQRRANPYSKPAFTKTGLNPSGPERDRPWPLRRYQLWLVSLKFWCQKCWRRGGEEQGSCIPVLTWWLSSGAPGDCMACGNDAKQTTNSALLFFKKLFRELLSEPEELTRTASTALHPFGKPLLDLMLTSKPHNDCIKENCH